MGDPDRPAAPFEKAKGVHVWALRDDLVSPVKHGVVEELEWYFRSKYKRGLVGVATPHLTMKEAAEKFGSGRYRALERLWLQEGYNAIGGIELHTLKEKCHLGRGRVSVHDLRLLAMNIGRTAIDNDDLRASSRDQI